MLDGSSRANAVMPWGKPGPIRLPDDPDERARLVHAHLEGAPADVLYSPRGRPVERLHIRQLVLAAFCPDAGGAVHWLGFDLDGPDHGDSGLADPPHAARCIAERAEAAGLLSGLLVARSPGGRGRHVFVIVPAPLSLADAVIGVAALLADAFKLAAADVADNGAPHAFRRADGSIARPGDAGAVELIPRSARKPERGWSLTLPTLDCIVDPFGGQPTRLTSAPRCNAEGWRSFVCEARARLDAFRTEQKASSQPTAQRNVRPLVGIR
jgi:hypothetical protein